MFPTQLDLDTFGIFLGEDNEIYIQRRTKCKEKHKEDKSHASGSSVSPVCVVGWRGNTAS